MANPKLSDYTIDESALTLQKQMQSVLDKVVGIYEAAGVPLPARRYWTFGRPAEDCEQVVVSFLQAYLGAPGAEMSDPQRCSAPRSVVVNVSVTRDFPIGQNGKAVNVDRIMESGTWSAIDVQVLLNSLDEFDQFQDFGPGYGVIATVEAADASGGMLTVNMNLTMGLG